MLMQSVNEPPFNESWPPSWKRLYHIDRVQIYGEGAARRGGAYRYEQRLRWVTDAVQRCAPPPARILDIAAAQGNYSLLLASAGYDVTWNDMRSDLAEYVRLKHRLGTMRYAPGNAFDLAAEEPYDIVLLIEIIEHVAHPDDLLKKIASLLRPGGAIVMTTPNGQYCRYRLPKFSDCPDPSIYETVQFGPNAEGHIFLLHEDELAPLAAASGLTLERVELFNNPLTMGHIKTEAVLHAMPKIVVRGIEAVTQRLPGALPRRLHSTFGIVLRKPG